MFFDHENGTEVSPVRRKKSASTIPRPPRARSTGRKHATCSLVAQMATVPLRGWLRGEQADLTDR